MNYLGLPKGNYFSGLQNQWSEPFPNGQNYGWMNQSNSWRGQEHQWSDPYPNGQNGWVNQSNSWRGQEDQWSGPYPNDQNFGWTDESNLWGGQENQWHSNHPYFNEEDPSSSLSHQSYSGFQENTLWYQDYSRYQENIDYDIQHEQRDQVEEQSTTKSSCDAIENSIARITQMLREYAQAEGLDIESEDVSIYTSINEVAEEQGTTIQCVQPDVPLASPPQQQQLQGSTIWHQEDPSSSFLHQGYLGFQGESLGHQECFRDQESHVHDMQQVAKEIENSCSNIERDLEQMLQGMQEESQAQDGDGSESEDMSIHTFIDEVAKEQSITIQCVQSVVPLISPPQQQQFQLSSNDMGCEGITLDSSNEVLGVIIPQLKLEDVEKVDCHELHPLLEDEFYQVDFEEDATKVFDSYGSKGVQDGKSSTQDASILARLHKIRGRIFKHQGFANQQRSSSTVVWWELKFKREPRIVGELASSHGEVYKFQTRDIWHKGQLYHEEDLGPGGSSIGTSCFEGDDWTQRETNPLHDPPP